MQDKGRVSSSLVRMKFSALMAFDGISSNLLRTFLTVLGISMKEREDLLYLSLRVLGRM